jgi:outer membrane protein assembly factor BamE (lipoprotein component of BamABCDE complex)
MRQVCFAFLLVFASAVASAADDLRVLKLEQDVRNLERTVQDLSRQIQELKLQLALSGGGPRVTVPTLAGARASWLDAQNWARLQPGMSEAQVVAVLGAPTSAREEDGARVLFYAMELAPEGVLGGRVTLRDGRVTEVASPTLR